MKNRVFAAILALGMLVSCILPTAVSASYSIPGADGGGLDFYSITIHYDQPTVVQYKSVTQAESKADSLIPTYSESGKLTYTAGYVFAEPEETRVIRAGDSLGAKGTAYNLYKSAVREGGGYVGNFIGLTGNGHNTDIYYTTFPKEYSYIHNIHDKDLIQSADPVSLRGVTEIVDDAGTKNPNIEFGADGYALDVNGGRIDDNGYLLDEHDEWYAYNSKGEKEKLQLFKVSLDEVVPMSRYDANGRIIKISQYEGAMVYVVDENGNIALDKQGNQRRGTPALGTPVMKSHITSITVELDALGTQLYTDKASDPQQNNTITVSIGNCKDNIDIIPGCGKILGVAKSVTTRTSMTWDRNTFDATMQSVPLEMTQEELDAISPNSDKIYVEFGVSTIQGEEAYSKKYIMANDYNSGLKKQELTILTEEDASNYATPVPKDDGSGSFVGSLLFWIIIGAVALLALAAVAFFVVIPLLKKKAAKKQTTQPETNSNQQYYTDEYGNQYYYDAATNQYYPVNAAQESGNTMDQDNQYITDENGNTFYVDESGAYYFYDTATEQWIPCDNQAEQAPAETATEESQAEDNHYLTDENGNTFYVDDNGAYYYYDTASEQWVPCDTQNEVASEEVSTVSSSDDNHYVTDENGNTFYVDDNGTYYYYDAVTEQWYPCENSAAEGNAPVAEEEQPATEETQAGDNHYITDENGNTFYLDDNGAYYYLDPATNEWIPCETNTQEQAPVQETPHYEQPQAQPQYQQPYGDQYAQAQYQQPMYGQPQYQQPMYGQPQYQQPMYGQPQYQQPMYGPPQYQQPMYGQPQYQQPMYEQPQYQQPMYGQPQYQQPMYGQPMYQQPMYGQPMYGQPMYGQPMYGQPQYQQPMYSQPQYQQPMYGQPQAPQYYNGYVENGYMYQDGNWIPVQ